MRPEREGLPRPLPLIFLVPFAPSSPASQPHIISGVHISVFFAAAAGRRHSVPAPASQLRYESSPPGPAFCR